MYSVPSIPEGSNRIKQSLMLALHESLRIVDFLDNFIHCVNVEPTCRVLDALRTNNNVVERAKKRM